MFLFEIASLPFVTEFQRLLNKVPRKISNRMLGALKNWAENEFKTGERFSSIRSLYQKLKSDGHNFGDVLSSPPGTSFKEQIVRRNATADIMPSTSRLANEIPNSKSSNQIPMVFMRYSTDDQRPLNESFPTTFFDRSIWIDSLDKAFTESKIADIISNKLNVSLLEISIACVFPSMNVYRIHVATEKTFETLLNSNQWPKSCRVREFF